MPAEDDEHYEVIDGRVVEKPRLGAYEGWLASWLIHWLNRSDAVGRHGQVVSGVLFDLEGKLELKRRPDLAFVPYERRARQRTVPMAEAWVVVPDLAVEVVSSSNSARDIVRKLAHYFKAGVKQVWVVYPIERQIYVYASRTVVRILQPGDVLDGGDVIPGFRLPLDQLFENGHDDAVDED